MKKEKHLLIVILYFLALFNPNNASTAGDLYWMLHSMAHLLLGDRNMVEIRF